MQCNEDQIESLGGACAENLLGPFFIGGVEVSNGLVLAPMSGVTDLPFRTLVRELNPGAIGLTVTEFISVEALTRESSRSLRMMDRGVTERPFSVQIFGHDIDRMVQAAVMAERAGADVVDINSGCPVPKVVRRGGGCELMRQPLHLARMLETVARSVKVPLTLKIRAGWDCQSRNAVEIARLAEQSGVAMLAMHGRTRTEGYRGTADWDLIADVVRSVSIPVCGSGDVVDAASYVERVKRSGVKGVLIGRGALANPWIFSVIAEGVTGAEGSPRPAKAVPEVLRRYESLVRGYSPEKALLGRMKQLASQVTRLVRGSAAARRDLCTAKTMEEFFSVLGDWQEALEAGRSYVSRHGDLPERNALGTAEFAADAAGGM